jgi:ubiquinone/menaquinone biosynthesis C-methylase UbiE
VVSLQVGLYDAVNGTRMMKSSLDVVHQQSIPHLVHRMREDWNSRAREDARFFVAFGQRNQTEQDFDATAADVVKRIRRDLPWLARYGSVCSARPLQIGHRIKHLTQNLPWLARPGSVRSRRFLEIGCGIGRLMQNIADECGEIHGVDISDEMIRLGRERLAGVSRAYFHVTIESDLRAFTNDTFDVVYSYAVMQHLPDRILFWRYLQEAFRVLKSGGLFIVQFNGIETENPSPDTWSGITVPAKEVAAACRAAGACVRSLEGENTQYTWITALKANNDPIPLQHLLEIEEVIGAKDRAGTIVAGGPEGFLSLFIRKLPDDFCDVTDLAAQIGSSTAPISYVSSIGRRGRRQVNAFVPDDTPIGMVPVRLLWRNSIISAPHLVWVVPPSPPSPRVLLVTDGVELSRHSVVCCGWAKIWVADLLNTDLFYATVHNIRVSEMQFVCEDFRARRYQVNLRVPEGVPAGVNDLVVYVGSVPLPAVSITIVRN